MNKQEKMIHPDIEKRIADLLSQMTLLEKAGQLTMLGPSIVGDFDFSSYFENPDPAAAGAFKFTSKYIDGPTEPLYPFGFGLSYTTFEYSHLDVTPTETMVNGKVVISAGVKNTGNVAGEEIVQLYTADLIASRVRPVKELKGFAKIHLAAGESRKVVFELDVANLGFFDEEMQYVVEAGKFKVWVGANSKEGLEGEFSVR